MNTIRCCFFLFAVVCMLRKFACHSLEILPSTLLLQVIKVAFSFPPHCMKSSIFRMPCICTSRHLYAFGKRLQGLEISRALLDVSECQILLSSGVFYFQCSVNISECASHPVWKRRHNVS